MCHCAYGEEDCVFTLAACKDIVLCRPGKGIGLSHINLTPFSLRILKNDNNYPTKISQTLFRCVVSYIGVLFLPAFSTTDMPFIGHAQKSI